MPRETLRSRAIGLRIVGTIYMKVKADITPEDIPIPTTPPQTKPRNSINSLNSNATTSSPTSASATIVDSDVPASNK